MVSDSLFRENMSTLKDKAYQALAAKQFMIEDTSLGEEIRIDGVFNKFWDAVEEVLQRDRANNNIAQMYEYYDSFTPDLWIGMIERWASANLFDFVSDIDNDEIFETNAILKATENILDELKMQITDALFKDSQNRATLVLDFVQNKNEELTASLGNEAAELLREIFDGLKKDESLRLDGPKTASPTPEASIKTDEELIDELDFLDDDISETLSLEDLEEELNLEDLVFSELKLD